MWDLFLLYTLTLLDLILKRVYLKPKGKGGADSNLWVYGDTPLKLLHNLFRDCKTQAHSVFVLLLGLFKKAK